MSEFKVGDRVRVDGKISGEVVAIFGDFAWVACDSANVPYVFRLRQLALVPPSPDLVRREDVLKAVHSIDLYNDAGSLSTELDNLIAALPSAEVSE